MPLHPTDKKPADAGRFAQTRWSIVVTAAESDPAKARKALEHLCTAYWYPLYAFVRREGHGAHDAQDLTQEFFARLLEKDWLGAVDPQKGKFRSFLLAAMRHFLANEWDRARRLKRGRHRAQRVHPSRSLQSQARLGKLPRPFPGPWMPAMPG